MPAAGSLARAAAAASSDVVRGVAEIRVDACGVVAHHRRARVRGARGAAAIGPMRSVVVLLVLVTAILGSARPTCAQDAAATLTPDRLHLLVNKPLGSERWSIAMNLSPEDPTKVVSVTGNVFRVDDARVDFVHCAVRPDSTGTLADPASTFRFTCRGTSGCAGAALACARADWTVISRDVAIPADFFLPEGGFGTAAQAGATSRWRPLDDLFAFLWTRLGTSVASLAPGDAVAQVADLAAVTLTPDLLNHLVVRDRSGRRWSIAFNVVRDDTRAGGFKATSVLGNTFSTGAPPAFVYCVPRSDSPATLEDPDAELRFGCLGSDGCTTTAQECASSWARITDDIALPASFFLPDGGRGTPPSSDDALVVLGSTSSVPSLASEQYMGSGSASCAEGEACVVDRIGACENVRGRLTKVDGVCRCFVSPVSPYCLRTGTEPAARIEARCGDACTFDVGLPAEDGSGILRKARGVSLPIASDSPNCFCHANPPGRLRAVEACGGVTGDACSGDRCCVDDPRDGCDPLAGDAGCSGICVAPASTDAGDTRRCGSKTLAAQFCGDGRVEGSEVCDPGTSPPPTCTSLGFSGGTLDCSTCVPRGCTGGDQPPAITSFEPLPSTVDTYVRHPVRGTFSDPDGDVTSAILSSDTVEIVYDVDGAGRRSGTFEVVVGCNGLTGTAGQIDFALDLADAAGNETETPEAVTAQCVVPPRCGDGVKEGTEECDPGSDDPSDACGDGQVCVNDCTCGVVTSCAGRCCPELDGFCGHSELGCRCDADCRNADRNDCCADAKVECGL